MIELAHIDDIYKKENSDNNLESKTKTKPNFF